MWSKVFNEDIERIEELKEKYGLTEFYELGRLKEKKIENVLYVRTNIFTNIVVTVPDITQRKLGDICIVVRTVEVFIILLQIFLKVRFQD